MLQLIVFNIEYVRKLEKYILFSVNRARCAITRKAEIIRDNL